MDQALPADFKEQVNRIEQRAMGRRLWLAASTHPGEDLPMLKIYQKLREQQTNLRLVMAPRHVHRSGEIKLASEGLGFKTCRISTTTEWSDYDVLVVDVMGQLTAWYGASEVAFVGGSLVPHGGHNFMEAAIAGCAVVTGPHLFNFESLADHFQQAEALCRGSSEQEVADQVFVLLNQEDARLRQVNKADRLVRASRGAIDRTLHQLSPWLPQGGVQ
jgi:3-deoxy-D-manno-octulosonic-acid transferase